MAYEVMVVAEALRRSLPDLSQEEVARVAGQLVASWHEQSFRLVSDGISIDD